MSSTSLDIFADAGIALGGFAFTLGRILNCEPLLGDDGQIYYSFDVRNAYIRLCEDHGYQSDKHLLLEDYQFQLSVEEDDQPDAEKGLAQKIFDALAATNKFRLLLVDNMTHQLQEYEPEPRLPIRRYPSYSRYVALFVDVKEPTFALAQQIESALEIQLKRIYSASKTTSHSSMRIREDDLESTLTSTLIYREATWLEYEDERLRIVVRNISNTSAGPRVPGQKKYNYHITLFGISMDWNEREPLRDQAARRLFEKLKQNGHDLLLANDSDEKLDEHNELETNS
jgi:hypothetical protein